MTDLKITVLGLWHLGCVTAACSARHFDVVGLDSAEVVEGLGQGKAPVYEPDLDALLEEGLNAGRLRFTADIASACAAADLLWVTHDTPVDTDDVADVEFVLDSVRACMAYLPRDARVLISSQLPVGTCAKLAGEFPGRSFSCSPENLRLGKAIDIFSNPDRVIVGCEDAAKPLLADLFRPFSDNIIWMNTASAEMTKHAINSFLALSITFMNEISLLCERTGADAKQVERGLKSESRIGPKAYLSPGGAFAGGTLARDIVTCIDLGQRYGESLEIFPAVKRSNDRHRLWNFRKLAQTFETPPEQPIALLGLTYKPGTDTLRRSSAVELARSLQAAGFRVRAYDPSLSAVPEDLAFIDLKTNVETLVDGAAALVVCTEWPQFRDRVDWPDLIRCMAGRIVLDPTRFLAAHVGATDAIRYVTVGSPS